MGAGVTGWRRGEESGWVEIGAPAIDGAGYLRFEDTSVLPGSRYGFRLGIASGSSEQFLGETWVDVQPLEFALLGAHPNPSAGSHLTVAFALTDARTAQLELFDLAGRRVAEREVGMLGPGKHEVEMAEGQRLTPGLYLARLTRAQDVRMVRVVVTK